MPKHPDSDSDTFDKAHTALQASTKLPSGVWWRFYFGTRLRTKLVIPALCMIVVVIAVLGWFGWDTVQVTVNNIYEQKARAIANVVSKSIVDEDYVLYYSEKIDNDLARLNRLYPDVYRITVFSEVRDTVRVISSTDPTLTGHALSSDSMRKIWQAEANLTLVEEGGQSFYQIAYPIYNEAAMIGLVQVDLSLAERDQYIQNIAWKTGFGFSAGILALSGLMLVLLRFAVSKPVSVLSTAAVEMSQGNYHAQANFGPHSPTGHRNLEAKRPIRDEIASLMTVFNTMVSTLRAKDERLQAMIVEDLLTGAYNRQHFDQVAKTEIERASRYQHPITFMLFDVQNLDGVNQAHGQAAGDQLLKLAAGLLKQTFRQVDMVFRYGGDEFVVLLPETDEQGASFAQQRFRQALQEQNQHQTIRLELKMKDVTWHPDPEVGWQIDHETDLRSILAQLAQNQNVV